jgi:hypothetical protein
MFFMRCADADDGNGANVTIPALTCQETCLTFVDHCSIELGSVGEDGKEENQKPKTAVVVVPPHSPFHLSPSRPFTFDILHKNNLSKTNVSFPHTPANSICSRGSDTVDPAGIITAAVIIAAAIITTVAIISTAAIITTIAIITGTRGTVIPEGYGKAPLYPMVAATFTTAGGNTHQVPCFTAGGDPASVDLAQITECDLDPQYFEFSEDVERSTGNRWGGCVARCPYPVYSLSELRTMWLCYVLPALVSVPLNLLIVCTKCMAHKKKTRDSLRPAVVGSAVISLIWAMCDAMPSLILFTDVSCGDGGLLQPPLTCAISRASINLLQMAMYLCAVMALDVYLAIVLRYDNLRRRKTVNVALVTAVVIPVMCMVACYALDDRDDADVFNKRHLSRQNFTCEPRLANVTQEWVFIHLHFVLGAAISAVASALTFRKMLKVSALAAEETVTSTSRITARRRGRHHFFEESTSFIHVVDMLRTIRSLRLVMMSTLSSTILLTYTIVNVFISSTLEEYTIGLDESFTKVALGGPLELPSGRPAIAVRALLYFSLACVPLLNGAIFVKQGHLKEILATLTSIQGKIGLFGASQPQVHPHVPSSEPSSEHASPCEQCTIKFTSPIAVQRKKLVHSTEAADEGPLLLI